MKLYLVNYETMTNGFNLFDFKAAFTPVSAALEKTKQPTQVAPAPVKPGVTLKQVAATNKVAQPIQNLKQSNVWVKPTGIIPKANASDKDVIQTFLDETKWDNNSLSKRNAVIEMIKNDESKQFIEDVIVNKMKFIPSFMKQQGKWFWSWVAEKTSEGFSWGIKKIQKAWEELANQNQSAFAGGWIMQWIWNLLEGWLWATQAALSPVTWLISQWIEEWFKATPKWFQEWVSSFVSPKAKSVMDWYNSQSPEQKQNLENIWIWVETLLNFVGWKTAEKAWSKILTEWEKAVQWIKTWLKQSAEKSQAGKSLKYITPTEKQLTKTEVKELIWQWESAIKTDLWITWKWIKLTEKAKIPWTKYTLEELNNVAKDVIIPWKSRASNIDNIVKWIWSRATQAELIVWEWVTKIPKNNIKKEIIDSYKSVLDDPMYVWKNKAIADRLLSCANALIDASDWTNSWLLKARKAFDEVANNMNIVDKDLSNFQNKVWKSIRNKMNEKIISSLPKEQQPILKKLLEEQSKLFDVKSLVQSKWAQLTPIGKLLETRTWKAAVTAWTLWVLFWGYWLTR